MSEKPNYTPQEANEGVAENYRLDLEKRNRQYSGENTTVDEIKAEEAHHEPAEKESAANRTYEVAHRIQDAKEIDKQRGILARLGMKTGLVKRTPESAIAQVAAEEENTKIEAQKAQAEINEEGAQRSKERSEKSKNQEIVQLEELIAQTREEIKKAEVLVSELPEAILIAEREAHKAPESSRHEAMARVEKLKDQRGEALIKAKGRRELMAKYTEKLEALKK